MKRIIGYALAVVLGGGFWTWVAAATASGIVHAWWRHLTDMYGDLARHMIHAVTGPQPSSPADAARINAGRRIPHPNTPEGEAMSERERGLYDGLGLTNPIRTRRPQSRKLAEACAPPDDDRAFFHGAVEDAYRYGMGAAVGCAAEMLRLHVINRYAAAVGMELHLEKT